MKITMILLIFILSVDRKVHQFQLIKKVIDRLWHLSWQVLWFSSNEEEKFHLGIRFYFSFRCLQFEWYRRYLDIWFWLRFYIITFNFYWVASLENSQKYLKENVYSYQISWLPWLFIMVTRRYRNLLCTIIKKAGFLFKTRIIF